MEEQEGAGGCINVIISYVFFVEVRDGLSYCVQSFDLFRVLCHQGVIRCSSMFMYLRKVVKGRVKQLLVCRKTIPEER